MVFHGDCAKIEFGRVLRYLRTFTFRFGVNLKVYGVMG